MNNTDNSLLHIVTATGRDIKVVPQRHGDGGTSGFAVKVDGAHRSWFHNFVSARDDADFLSFSDYCKNGMVPGSTHVIRDSRTH